jgi:cytidylate kinase
MKITIFGTAGTGTSTLAKNLSKQLNLTFFSTGNLMRKEAEMLGMTIYEFDELCKKNPKYDIALDKKVETIGKTQDNFVFDSRLAWYFIPDSIKIYCYLEDTIAYQRIAERENISIKEAQEKNEKRNRELIQRYKQIYPQLCYPPKKEDFDIVVDSKQTPEECVENVLQYLKEKKVI